MFPTCVRLCSFKSLKDANAVENDLKWNAAYKMYWAERVSVSLVCNFHLSTIFCNVLILCIVCRSSHSFLSFASISVPNSFSLVSCHICVATRLKTCHRVAFPFTVSRQSAASHSPLLVVTQSHAALWDFVRSSHPRPHNFAAMLQSFADDRARVAVSHSHLLILCRIFPINLPRVTACF